VADSGDIGDIGEVGDLDIKQRSIVPWIIGLTLLALLLAWLALALHRPAEAGADDGTSAVENPQDRQPRSLRQYA
jgi:hypothetical protein